MPRRLDDDLMNANAGQNRMAVMVAIRRRSRSSLNRRILIRHDANAPAGLVRSALGTPQRQHLGGRAFLMPFTEWAMRCVLNDLLYDQILRPRAAILRHDHPLTSNRIVAQLGHRGFSVRVQDLAD